MFYLLIVLSIPTCVITSVNGLLVVITGKKFGKCLPLTMMAITFLLYFSQYLLHTFYPAYIILFIIGMIFIIACITRKVTCKRELFFSYGFYAFLAIVLLNGILDYKKFLHFGDDIFFWGLMTKEMCRLDAFYSDASISRVLVNLYYPPFSQLFEMFWCMLSGGYSETAAAIGMHVFLLTLIIPATVDNYQRDCESGWESFIHGIITSMIVLMIIASMDAAGLYVSLYKDIFLAVLFAYGMSLMIIGEVYTDKFDYVSLIFVSAALLLTKQMGIAFDLILWFYFIINAVYGENKIKGIRYRVSSLLVEFVIMISVSVLPYLLWKHYINILEINAKFNLNKLNFNTLLEVLKGNPNEALRIETLRIYAKAIMERSISGTSLPITYPSSYLLVILLLTTIIFIAKENREKARYESMLLGVTFLLGTIGWALTLGLLYLFCFAEDEVLALANSYERYMSCYVIGELLVLLVVLYREVKKRKNVLSWNYLFVAFSIIVLVTNSVNLSHYIPYVFLKDPYSYREEADYIEKRTEGGVNCFVVSYSMINSQYGIQYYGEDIRVDLCYIDVLNADYSDEKTKKEITKEIFSNDYVFIKDVSDNFNQVFSAINNGKKFETGRLYKVKWENERIVVEMV